MGTLTSYPFYPPQSFPVFSNSTTVNMEVLLGLTGRDFTIIAASKAAMRGATILKSSDDKTRQLNKHTLLAFSGEPGDTIQFAEYIQANAALYTMRNEADLSPSAVASFVRGELARSLRSQVCIGWTISPAVPKCPMPPTDMLNTTASPFSTSTTIQTSHLSKA